MPLEPSHASRERVEHAVHEPRALLAAEPFREPHRFLNARRAAASPPRCSSAAPRRSTQRSITPMRSSRQLVVTSASSASSACAVARDDAKQLSGELALVGRDGEIVPDERETRARSFVRAKVPRVERLERALARPRDSTLAIAADSSCAESRRVNRSTISSAASAASHPLLPCAPPARASACSSLSLVSNPKPIGR